jgi:hypothetical protein
MRGHQGLKRLVAAQAIFDQRARARLQRRAGSSSAQSGRPAGCRPARDVRPLRWRGFQSPLSAAARSIASESPAVAPARSATHSCHGFIAASAKFRARRHESLRAGPQLLRAPADRCRGWRAAGAGPGSRRARRAARRSRRLFQVEADLEAVADDVDGFRNGFALGRDLFLLHGAARALPIAAWAPAKSSRISRCGSATSTAASTPTF